jgi:KaiC/GvpD/RAD55 family RecA-like ATPase
MMAEKTKVSLCADLLRAVFEENKELLLELQLREALGRYDTVHAVLSELHIDHDLVVDAASMPDTEESLVAIAYLIHRVQSFMELFEGEKEAEKRISDAVTKFGEENQTEIQTSGLANALPQFFYAGDVAAIPDLDTATDLEKVRQVFIDVFSQHLEEDSEGERRNTLLNSLKDCASLTSIADDAAWFEFADGASLSVVVEQLSGVVDILGVTPEAVGKIFVEYGRIPEELGIIQSLFHGALSDFTTFGLRPIDALLRSGLGRDATLLFEGPTAVEKDILCYLFLKRGLEENGCVIIVSTHRSPDRIRNGLASLGVDIETGDAEGRLGIGDGHTRHRKQITGIEESGSVIQVSNDLTNLAVGIDIALKRAVNSPNKRLLLDMVSPTIMVEGFDRVNEFLNSVKAKLRNMRCTGLITLNPLTHLSEEINKIKDKFDGTLSLSRSLKDGRFRSEVHFSSFDAGPFDSSHILMDVNDHGILFSDIDKSFKEEERLAFDHGDEKFSLGFPGIENLTAGGLPIGRSFLIWKSSKMAPGEIIKPLITEAIGGNRAVVLALSTVPPDEITEWLAEIDHSVSRLIERGTLEIVDWQAQKDTHILGVEEMEGIIKASKDITNLGVGIDLALRKVNTDVPSVAILEILSPAFRILDQRTVYPFAQAINARLDSRGFTTFVVMERDAHDSRINAGIEEIYDGVLDVMDAGDHLELAVLNLRDSHFQPEYRKLSRLRTGFSVDIAKRETETERIPEISEEMNIRIERLNRELKEALDEKSELEERTEDLKKREGDLQRKHDELRLHLVELENRIVEQQKEMVTSTEVRTEENKKHMKELARILTVMDDMLEHLPEDMIEKFANSDEYKLYEKILAMYLEDKE